MKPATVMIIENNPDLRNTLRHAFETHGYMTWTCPSPEIAVSIFAAIRPNVVLLDLDLEGANSLHLIDAWKELSPHTRVYAECSRGDGQCIQEARDHGVEGFLIKPYALTPLFELLDKNISQHAA